MSLKAINIQKANYRTFDSKAGLSIELHMAQRNRGQIGGGVKCQSLYYKSVETLTSCGHVESPIWKIFNIHVCCALLSPVTTCPNLLHGNQVVTELSMLYPPVGMSSHPIPTLIDQQCC